MRLRPEQLPTHLARGLAPIYVVSGDEPLQLGEAVDAIRLAARQAGFAERIVLDADTGFEWHALAQHLESFSLFAERRLIELRLPASKPGDAGAAVLTRYAAHPHADNLLLLSSGRLDARATGTKWYRQLDAAGVTVQVWPLEAARLPQWIERRMGAAGGRITPAAARALAERVEGNLLACAQEIAKLRMLYGSRPVEVDEVLRVVADSARFDVFDLVQSALGGNAARTLRILGGLREEGVEALPVLGTLTWAVRSLAAMARERAAGRDLEQLFRAPGRGVWKRRQKEVGLALRRHPYATWLAMLASAAEIDAVIKGAPGDAWVEMERLALAICGVMIFQGGGYNARS